MICLLPWEEEPHNYGAFEIYYFRRDLNNKIHAQITFEIINGKYYTIYGYYSFEDAAIAMDKLLISKNYYLIPKNEVERFKEKLIILQ